jgi:hypothetical protein
MHAQSDAHQGDLIGAQVAFGATRIGEIEAVLRDPVSHRVPRLVMRYGADGRRVAVPMEWVVRRTGGRVVLGVGTHSLDDLPDQTDARKGLPVTLMRPGDPAL